MTQIIKERIKESLNLLSYRELQAKCKLYKSKLSCKLNATKEILLEQLASVIAKETILDALWVIEQDLKEGVYDTQIEKINRDHGFSAVFKKQLRAARNKKSSKIIKEIKQLALAA